MGLVTGLQIVITNDHAVHGYHNADVGLKITAQGGTPERFDAAIQLGASSASWPIVPTGSLIEAVHNSTDTVLARASKGVDFLPVKISNVAFRSQGFSVDGSGNLKSNGLDLGTLQVVKSNGDVSVSVARQVATSAVVSTGGAGHYVGEILVDSYGGVYEVLTISGTAVATISMLVPPTASTPPSNPVSISSTDDARIGGVSIGCTINLTWSGSTSTLSLTAPTQVRIGTTVSSPATNGVAVVPGTTGTGVALKGVGVDSTARFTISAAGSGETWLGNDTYGASLRVTSPAGAIAGYIQITGSTTGNDARIIAAGEDNTGILMSGQGVSNFTFQSGGNGNQFQVQSRAMATGTVYIRPATSSLPAQLTVGGSNSAVQIFGAGVSETMLGSVGINGSPVRTLGARADGSGVGSAPVSGATVTIPNNCSWQHINPSGALSSLTVVMPANPIGGQEVLITVTQPITSFTLSPNTGQTISGPPTTMSANTSCCFRYRVNLNNWVRLY